MTTEIDYFSDDVAKPTCDLNEIVEAAIEADELQKRIDELNYQLQEVEQAREKLVRGTIPELMELAGIAEFKLADGTTLKVASDIKCGITQANKAGAFGWLEENGFGGIIKTKVLAEFGRDELEEAQKAVAALESAGYDAQLDRSVHAATLKSFVKEQLEEGTAIPIDLFGIFEFKTTKFTKPRVRK